MGRNPQLGQQSHSEAFVVYTTAISFNLQSILQASFPSLPFLVDVLLAMRRNEMATKTT